MTEDRHDLAIHWMLRTRAGDMDEAEWDAFTCWLEESPDNAALLDAVQAADDGLESLGSQDLSAEAGSHGEPTDDHAPSSSASAQEPETAQSEGDLPMASNENDPDVETLPEAANDNQFKRFLPFAGLVAAAIAVFALWPAGAPTQTLITTEPGEVRTIAVSDDITMTLNGGTEVTLIEEETRVQVARGEVAFEIDSDEPSPLRVEVADLVLADYGTIFNVVLNNSSVSVAVAEGAVGINPETDNVEVQAGEQVTRNLSGGALVRTSVETDTVGSWQEGRLEFDNTPAPQAVEMLERSIGSKVTLAEALEGETLTGSLIVSENERETVTQFASILGARARRGRLAGYGMVWDVR